MAKDLKKYEAKLKKTQADLEAELKGHPEVPEMGAELDAFDTETDEAEEYSNDLGVKDALKNRLRAVRAALERIKAGAYGKCEKCGMEIPEKVLEVNPESELCTNCNQSIEVQPQ